MTRMTRESDDDVAAPEAPADGPPAGGTTSDAYQPPRLIYVGNVHALLAGNGMSTPDGPKGSKAMVG